MTTVETSKWLRPVREWAAITGISKTELYRRIAAGTLRARKINSVMRIHRDDIEAMVASLPRVGD